MTDCPYAMKARRRADAIGVRPELDGVDVVIEQRVHDGDMLVANYHVTIRDQQLTVVDGPADAPTVVITQDQTTADGLRSGDLHAQSAYLTGALTVSGDVAMLVEHGGTLAGLLGQDDA